MKSHVWILLLISILTFINATSNDSTSAAVKFILSPSTLIQRPSTGSSDILIERNMLAPSMSLAYPVTTPQTIQRPLGYFANVHNQESRRYKSVLFGEFSKTKRSLETEREQNCSRFSIGNELAKTFESPGFTDQYMKNITCVRTLEAPVGYLLRLDFRDHFNIEPSEGCKFDYLEIRDGEFGFSTSLGKFCGHNFPDIITSKGRFLWLQFQSDENIEYEGFKAVYEFVPRPTSAVYDDTECGGTLEEFEGFVNNSMISKEKNETVIKYGLPLDCMWVIKVPEKWKIQLSFLVFKLEKPNDCEKNFVDIFHDNTEIQSRTKNFCGSIADSVQSKSNIIHIRYFVEAAAINSSFNILYTAFREKDKEHPECNKTEEYDCEDQTCIKKDLVCNGNINCRFRWDEDKEKCDELKKESQSEHVVIIVVVFSVILTALVIAFIVNCMRKIIRDHKIIREHIRQSRESKLDELGRHSTKMTKSRENIALAQLTKIPPPNFDPDSPTAINFIENNATNQHFYRDTMPSSNGARTIDSKNDLGLREQEIKNILGSSYDEDQKDGEMCDMACQTRESLFQPVFQKNKVTQSPMPSGLRFSTFGYMDSSIPPAPCPTHSQSNKGTLPHQHGHHHHYHHIHSGSNNQSSADVVDRGTGTSERRDEFRATMDNDDKRKFLLKRDDPQARSFSDVRKSAPDVVIIAGCTSSH